MTGIQIEKATYSIMNEETQILIWCTFIVFVLHNIDIVCSCFSCMHAWIH